MVRRLSNISTLRGAPPTSPEVAYNFMNFRFSHLKQMATRPSVLGEGNDRNVAWGTCNPGGSDAVSTRAQTGQAFGEGGMKGPPNDPSHWYKGGGE
jgi:hypothetical protein